MRNTFLNTKRAAQAGTLALVLAVAFFAGCKRQVPTAPDDQQMTSQIQTKLGAEQALAGQSIQVQVANGVATLNGAVTSDAARVLAGNEAGTIDGVKTVVNNLTVQQAAAVEPAAPAPVEKPAPAAKPVEKKAKPQPVKQQYTPVPAPVQSAPQEQVAQVQTPPPPPAPPRPVVKEVTLPAGTVIPVRITETLDSKTAQPNDAFHASLAGDLRAGDVLAIPRGTAVMGRIVDAKGAAHFKGNSLLSLELTQMTARGQRIQLATDSYSKEGAGRGKNTAAKAGGGAALGAIIGALAGGGKGAAIGGLAGAGAGTGVNAATRGQEVTIPSETLINFRLQAPITLTVTIPPQGAAQDDSDPALRQRQ